LKKKITDQDKKDWKKFTESRDKLDNKDKEIIEKEKNIKKKTIDLHGFSLENANKTIKEFIKKSYLENISLIKVITGKGSRSNNEKNPYLSSDLSILKYSVPNYIKNTPDLMKMIKELDLNSVRDKSQGTFDIILKKKL
jgi:DNA-nicking Smr family endonuclease|tara:strand:- start:1591 stop:2007 length:417 start_codon:yes stop_codon:yes gene_type:complete